MQLTNTPGKLVLPFANAGAKNTIPTASQIGITAGAASLTDGFPPLTRTPIAAGGVPPSGLDMNGILYALSAALRWAAAGGGYAFDATFAGDSNVNGYPRGARVMRSDGVGYWLNTVENNTTDPEGGSAAGWVPDLTNGVAAVTMTSANVTLTALQYGKPLIVISGTLTANLNLIFPAIAGEWTVANNTTGAFSITCKTASGTGVPVSGGCATVLYGDGTNIYSADNDVAKLFNQRIASAGGTVDAITAAISPAPRTWEAGVPFFIRAAGANATTTPTFTPNSGTLAAKTIVKGANAALVAGDISGAGHWLMMQYDATLDKVVLLNPAYGVNSTGGKLLRITRYTTAGSGTWTKQADTNSILVRAVGGGGGGGGGTTANNQAGNGGYSGCYGEKLITAPAASYAYTVGAAGSGGGVAAAGSAGGQTSFGALTLTGGPGGQPGQGSLVTLPTGSGWDFTSASVGQPGSADSTSNAHGNGGLGGPSPFAGGGGQMNTGTIAGNYGSGGGGGSRVNGTGAAGSAGGAGYIEVWEFA